MLIKSSHCFQNNEHARQTLLCELIRAYAVMDLPRRLIGEPSLEVCLEFLLEALSVPHVILLTRVKGRG